MVLSFSSIEPSSIFPSLYHQKCEDTKTRVENKCACKYGGVCNEEKEEGGRMAGREGEGISSYSTG